MVVSEQKKEPEFQRGLRQTKFAILINPSKVIDYEGKPWC